MVAGVPMWHTGEWLYCWRLEVGVELWWSLILGELWHQSQASTTCRQQSPLACLQAHTACVAGACLAVGIRFAGSANARAEALLRRHAQQFLAAKQRVPEPGTGEYGWGL